MRRRNFFRVLAAGVMALGPLRQLTCLGEQGWIHTMRVLTVCTWIGSAQNNWNDPSSWLNGRMPRDGDSVIVTTGSAMCDPEWIKVRLDTLTIERGAIVGTEDITYTLS